MSRSDELVSVQPVEQVVVVDDTGAVSGRATLWRSELGLVFRRKRNLALLAVLVGATTILGLAVFWSSGDIESDGSDLDFVGNITRNGLFLSFAALTAALPFFLPLSVSVVSGEAVAGEAATGTLRYLLTVPVGRLRLLGVKYLSIVAFAAAGVLVVTLTGLALGGLLFGFGDVTLLSGDTIDMGDALWRAALVAGYLIAMLAGLGAIGLFFSVVTEVPMAAMATTTVLAILSQILDQIPQLDWLHEWLFTHWWLVFGDLLRNPVPTEQLMQGLLTTGVYAVVFLTAAWAWFSGKDITA